MIDRVLDRIFCVMDAFFCITKPHFCFASDLLVDALGFLLFVSNEFPGSLLDLASEVLNGALDLIFVHDGFPLKVNELLRN
jgi:hypothetical protein